MIADTADLAASFPGRCRVLFSDETPALGLPKSIETGRQAAGDLGARLTAAISEGLASGAKKIVVLGSDSPHLPAARLTDALDALDRADLVLGPAEDGGYYLIAVRRFSPAIFDGVEWGSARVFEQTSRAAARAGFSISSLASFYDLDEWRDLQRLAAEPDNSAPRTRKLIS